MLSPRSFAYSAILLALPLFCGCSLFEVRTSRVLTTSCEPVANIRAIAKSKLVFFGELHGTNEGPTLVGEVACEASRDRSVIVALEWPISLQLRVARYLQGNGEPLTVADLLEHPFWRTKVQDGRSSESMLRLLDRLRALRSNGAHIAVSLFDDSLESNLKLAERDCRFAERLLELYRSAANDTQILVLTGNLHSRVTRGVPWNGNFESAAYLLRALNPLALDMGHLGGAAWSCGRDLECSAHKFKANLDDGFTTSKPSLVVNRDIVNGHHGFFVVGSISASPPALPPVPQNQ